MSKTHIPAQITPDQFTQMAHRAQQSMQHGDELAKPADRLIRAWHRLDTITNDGMPERTRAVLSVALQAGGAVVREAASQAGSKSARATLFDYAHGMDLDAAQNALITTSDNKDSRRSLIDGVKRVAEYYRNQNARHHDAFMRLNTRSLLLQLQVEQARDMRQGAPRTAALNVLQASLGGLINDSADHLAGLGVNYSEYIERHNTAAAQKIKGLGGEFAHFTRQLTDWYQHGILQGNPARFALYREDVPHTGKPHERRGFDTVVMNPERTLSSYVQVKSTTNTGAGYAPEITFWKPADPDFMDAAIESASWFGRITGGNAIGSVATAEAKIDNVIGHPTEPLLSLSK